MSRRNPDRLAPGAQAPRACIFTSRPGGPVKNCFFFDCQGCMLYPRLKKAFDLTDLERKRCLLPIPGGWNHADIEVPHVG